MGGDILLWRGYTFRSRGGFTYKEGKHFRGVLRGGRGGSGKNMRNIPDSFIPILEYTVVKHVRSKRSVSSDCREMYLKAYFPGGCSGRPARAGTDKK